MATEIFAGRYRVQDESFPLSNEGELVDPDEEVDSEELIEELAEQARIRRAQQEQLLPDDLRQQNASLEFSAAADRKWSSWKDDSDKIKDQKANSDSEMFAKHARLKWTVR